MKTVSSLGKEKPKPGLMSPTRLAFVPSKLHSSLPFGPSSAEKNSLPSNRVRSVGVEPKNGLMSAARVAVVPSDFHSSVPLTPSSAVK